MAASGTNLGYQWRKDGDNLAGAQQPTLALSGVGPGEVGGYSCAISGDCGAATTRSAALALLADTAITANPQDHALAEGEIAVLSVAAQGDGLTYQWQTSADGGATYGPIPGATGPSYSTPPLGIGDDGRHYRCVVGGTCGAAVSEVAMVTVLRAQEIALYPGWNLVSLSVIPVDTVAEAVLSDIAGGYSLVYAWRQGAWAIHDPASPAASDIVSLDNTSGFWVLANAPITLRVLGRVPAETAVPLGAGWSLSGFPSSTARPLPGALCEANAGPGIQIVYGYAAGEQPAWRHHEYAAAAWSNTLEEMIPGRGYWILSAQANEWRVTY